MTTEFSLGAVRFEDVRTGIVNYLKENGTYKADFDFNGSNIAYLIDSAAYMTMIMSYQNTILSNNIFLDTTEIRKNAISISKRMGYRPKRKVSSQFTGTIEYFANQDETFEPGDTMIIPSRATFISSPSRYQFVNLLPITLTYENAVQLTGSFILTEGNFKTVQTFGTAITLQEIVISSENVEENNMSVFVRANNTDASNNIQWTEIKSFFTTIADEVYFVEEDIVNEKRPKILFGDGTLGQIPTNTETITIEYLETLGDTANDETSVEFINGTQDTTKLLLTDGTEVNPTFIIADGDFTYTFNNLQINLPELQVSFAGKDNGSLEEIQFNAPRFFSAAGRGVTDDDYLFLLSSFSSTLLYSNVIGGNKLFPDDPTEKGIIYIAGVPAGTDEDNFRTAAQTVYLTEVQENVIIPQIEVPTVTATVKRFIKPSYILLQLNPFIEVPDSFTTDETQTSINDVEINLDTYIAANLRGLEKQFRHSKLLSVITGSAGVLSTELDIIHNFIVNNESFYQSRITRMNLPVIFSRDINGDIILDDNNIPVLTNFVKKRTDIVTKENESRIAGATEKNIITTVSDVSDSLGGKYFTISEMNVLGNEVRYYIWFDTGSSTDPAPIGITNGVQVSITTGNSETIVATKLAAALGLVNSSNAFTATSTGKDVTITNKNKGFILNNAADIDTTFTFVLVTRGLDTNFYDQFTLPAASSSLFGSLTHPNSDRKLYNIDITSIEFITFKLIGALETLNFRTFPFKDKDNVEHTPNLVESSTDVWNIQLNGRNIGILNKISATSFTVTGVDELYLKDNIGVIPADDETTLVNIDSITETDEDEVETSFFSLNFLLDNNVFSDVRIYGKTKIADAAFDAKNFTWTYTNTPTFESVVAGPDVTFSTTDVAALNENFLQVTHDVDDNDIVLSMRNFNGTFSLTNFNLDYLVRYDFRNDFELITSNFKTTQEPSQVTYQVSTIFTKDSNNVQQIDFISPEATTVTTIANSANLLDGKFFFINSALDATNYYVWIDSASGLGNDPAPIGSYTGIQVSVLGTETAENVALAIETALNVSGGDFTALVQSGNLDTLDITNIANGRTTNSADPTITLSAAVAYDATILSYTDETTEANDATANNMTLLPATGAVVNDAYYFAKDHKFDTLTIDIGTAGVGSWVIDWEYWDGDSWETLSATDGTSAFTTVGTGLLVNWDFPSDWASTNLNVLSGAPSLGPFYWVRARVTTGDISGITPPTGDITTVSGGLGNLIGDSFILSTSIPGADNLTTDIDKILPDDLLVFSGSGNVNNDGTFMVKSVDSATGIVEVYNSNGVLNISGAAAVTHFQVTSGTYGDFTINGFDIYHDVSIGTLKYQSGDIEYKHLVKGYTDLANSETIIKNIKSIFNNYTSTSRMDLIKIIPIDRYSNTSVFLGQQNDFDSIFSQSIQTEITTPTIKT